MAKFPVTQHARTPYDLTKTKHTKMHRIHYLLLPLLFFSFIQDNPCGYYAYDSLEEALKAPEKVTSLDLGMQHPKLITLPPAIGQLTELECLDASFNRIGSLPGEMKHLKKLRYLNLAGNRYLSRLPEVLKELPALETVDLTGIPEWSTATCEAARKVLPGVTVLTDK